MFPLRIALRYLFSKKSANAINLLSYISMAGMGVGAFALIIVLSVLNGFEGLIKDLYNAFYPEVIIRPHTGKWMNGLDTLEQILKAEEPVVVYAKTLEENAYLEYEGKATVAAVKGVDEHYIKTTDVAAYVRSGDFLLRDSLRNYAVIGANINMALNASPDNVFAQLSIRVPRFTTASVFLPDDAFNTAYVYPAGIFSIQQEFDSKYVFIPLEVAQELVGETGAVSSIEVKLKEGAVIQTFCNSLRQKLGTQYDIKTRDEMNATLYRVVKIERFAVFSILTFILSIISFNIIGSLTMLAIEKKKDVSIMKAMGATQQQIAQIFLCEGVLNGLIGAMAGLAIGLLVCWLQINYGFIKLGEGGASFVVDAYPVNVKIADVGWVFVIVAVLSFMAAAVPAVKASRQSMEFGS